MAGSADPATAMSGPATAGPSTPAAASHRTRPGRADDPRRWVAADATGQTGSVPAARTITGLPVADVLPAVTAALTEAGTAILVAPPGTGKTTLTPLILAEAFDGRIVIAQPRRIAARAAARRMAFLLGEEVGATVGYAVRGERRTSAATRIEVVTTGLLLRRLQHDPELPGTAAVLLDECHERQLDADLALAFAVEARSALRPDLRLLAMSATAAAEPFAELLGGPGRPAPVITARSALHPVTSVWAPPPASVHPGDGVRVAPGLLDHIAATVRRALHEQEGDVLVFLPGAGEIAGVRSRLSGLPDIALLPLHGRQSGREQDAALRPSAHRRVVLATAVAETSLTVPGVRVVVDSGLARVARMDHGRGLGGLVTVPVSRATAEQRAGRAGREAPGHAYRCWPAAHHERLAAQPEPEVATADLTGFALHLACWGDPDGSNLPLLDAPPPTAMRLARASLTTLGAVDETGRATARGRAMAATGTHPRLARALLDGAAEVGTDRAVEIVALLSEEVSGRGDDLAAAWRALRAGSDPAATARWRAEIRRLRATLPAAPRPSPAGLPDDLAAALVVALAHPERLARARQPGGATYLMAGGTAADLTPGSALTGAGWLAVAVADRAPGGRSARIRLAAALDEATALTVAGAMRHTVAQVDWVDGDVRARTSTRVGAIVVDEHPLTRPDRAAITAALLRGLEQEGLGLLDWTPAARALRERLAFCHRVLGDPWPAMDDDALLAAAPRWLGPELSRARRRADLGRVDVPTALRRLLPWQLAARLDEVAPERIAVPSGSRIRLDYADPAAPVLAVKLQETFGWQTTPRVGDGRVPVVLHLLSPAGRPVAVTGDLPSFWRTGYPQVRGELRGRYPRHPWPADPGTAAPTRRTTPRR